MNLNDYLYAKVKLHYLALAGDVERNCHMHNYAGAQRSQDDVLDMLTKYVDYTFMVRATWREKKPQETKIIDLLTMLVGTAKDFRGLYDKNEKWTDKDCLDAYLVAFINGIAADMGVDYALYARDLSEPGWRNDNADARVG